MVVASSSMLIALIRDDLRARWSGGMVAWGWMFLHPLAQIAVFAVVFGLVMIPRAASFPDHRAYVIYLCLGFFPWLAVSEGVARGASSILEGAGLLRRTALPLMLFPLRVALSAWVLAVVAVLITLLAAPFLGVHVHANWLLIPAPLISLILLTIGLSCMIAPLTVLFRDTAQVVHLGLPLLMWTAPIVYVPDILPGWTQTVQQFHPLAPALGALHGLVLHGALPTVQQWLLLVAYPGITLVAGWLILRACDDEVRDAL